MIGPAFERVVAAAESQGSAVTPLGNGRASAQAPGHSPSDRSVTITGIEGQVLVHSHSDPTDQVLDAWGITKPDLFDDPRGATYKYSDGRTVFRSPTKKFSQSGNTKGKALFRVEKASEAIAAGTPVYVTEGEKCALAIESVGGVAVSSAMGAGKAHLFDWTPLHGGTVLVIADKDEKGYRHARDILRILDGKADSVVIEAKAGKDAADHIATGHGLDEFVPVEEPQELSVVRLSDVVAERVSWLWPGRIPAGKLVTLDGDPSLGKSTLALTFAAVITTGGLWPDGSRCDFQGDVILLSAEDGLADTVRPRLDAAGADVRRVHAVQGVTLEDGTLRPPTLADVGQLQRLVEKTGARLLVVDVLMAYLPSGTDSHKDQDIRRVLSRLSALADCTGCTVLLLRHLNKAKGGDPMYRGGGSIGIVGAARAGMLVARDPDDEDVRVLASTKSNLGPPPEALTYRLANVDELGVARVEWIGTSTHDARALLADSGDESDERNEIAEIIRGYLIDLGGSAPAADVLKHARAAGLSEPAVKKARKKAGVSTKRQGFGPGAVWVWSIDSPIGAIDTGPREAEPMESMATPMTLAKSPKPDRTVVPLYPTQGSVALALAMGSQSPPAGHHLCKLCDEPCPSHLAAHLDCVLDRSQAENFGYQPVTPGAVSGQWIGSGRQVEKAVPE